jgi:hypothetical protein
MAADPVSAAVSAHGCYSCQQLVLLAATSSGWLAAPGAAMKAAAPAVAELLAAGPLLLSSQALLLLLTRSFLLSLAGCLAPCFFAALVAVLDVEAPTLHEMLSSSSLPLAS